MRTTEQRDALYHANAALTTWAVNRTFPDGVGSVTREDLLQVASLALLKAAAGWDESRGIKFSTYAVRVITRRLLYEVYDHARLIRVPRYLVGKGRRELLDRLGTCALPGGNLLAEDADGLAEDADGPAEILEARELREDVRSAVEALPPRLRAVVEARSAGRTLVAVADGLGVTKERARQIEGRAHGLLGADHRLSQHLAG